MVWYPDEEIVLETHRIMIEKYGGRLGFERGIEAFKHILADVKVAKGIYRKATILLRRLVTGRIFKDGNHRTAQAVTMLFLEMNDVSMNVQDSEKIIRFIKGILFYSIDEIEAWLKDGKLPQEP